MELQVNNIQHQLAMTVSPLGLEIQALEGPHLELEVKVQDLLPEPLLVVVQEQDHLQEPLLLVVVLLILVSRSMRDRFNQHNDRVIPLKKCSELIVAVLYKIKNAARVNTKFGPSIRVETHYPQSPTGNVFLLLLARFRDLSNRDLDEINA